MKEIGGQLILIWQQMSLLKRIALLAFFGLVVVGCYALLQNKKTPRVESVLVNSPVSEKGFELFDSGTWIKGEKELQVLEIRALKGQLEADLASYDSISEARVILDLAPNRSLRSHGTETSASVILSLEPGSVLTESQLWAISYHLAGAVRGLSPDKIAISDTTGRLYKTLDAKLNEAIILGEAERFEETLSAKLSLILTQLFGPNHAFCLVALDENKVLQVGVGVDEKHCREGVIEALEGHIKLLTIAYPKAEITIDALPFFEEKVLPKDKSSHIALAVLIVIAAVLCSLPFIFIKSKQRKRKTRDVPSDEAPQIDLSQLTEKLDTEDPEAIAMMITLLPKARGEEILSHLPKESQAQVLQALAQVEKGEI